jgi:hypothetical protein
MGKITDDYALLLAAPSMTEVELAEGLLREAGIPFITHGLDRDLAELGTVVHDTVARPDLYVPKAALDKARAVLREAWGDDADIR